MKRPVLDSTKAPTAPLARDFNPHNAPKERHKPGERTCSQVETQQTMRPPAEHAAVWALNNRLI